MIAAAAVFAIALIAAIWLLLRQHAEAQAQWAVERRELLNRIQRPELIPVAAPEQFDIPDPEIDESELVGTIAYPEPEDGEG